MYIGFSVGGVDWLSHDLVGATSQAEREDRLRHVGFEEARLTHAMGGNLLRVFYYVRSILAPFADGVRLDYSSLPWAYDVPWYAVAEEQKLEACDRALAFMKTVRHALKTGTPDGSPLALAELDAYLDGVASYGSDRPSPPIQVLLTNVVQPPVPILEAPRDSILAAYGKKYRFADLWKRYCDMHARIARALAHRYVVQPKGRRVVCAFEIANEPDYEWLPDEFRIEKAWKREVNATRKYITELHNPQIPDTSEPPSAPEPMPWGFREHEGPWREQSRRPRVPVLEYDWGDKFDWYVRCYAEYAARYSQALWDTTRAAGHETHIISGGVTHNNLDYLVRVDRANADAFTYCTGIGFHPYHWPQHNVYDKQFRRMHEPGQWLSATPRAFASDHFKCFDFFTEFNRLCDRPGIGEGLKGKPIWLTEFGLASKLMGTYNEAHWELVPFIRPRALPADALPRKSIVWEDLWDAFFDQVTPAFLASERVQSLCFFTLRETAAPALDKHDDDRSNLAVLRRSGLPRLDPATFERLMDFMCATTATPRRPDQASITPMPAWARKKYFSTRLLQSQPWRGVPIPGDVRQTVSMLSEDEKHLLFWLTSEYFTGAGAIIDAGCFAGGSTVALAAGLAAVSDKEALADPRTRIDSFDRFITDEYMRVWYFEQNQLKTEGDRFRNIFDAIVHDYRSMVRVFDGDITQTSWEKEPVEVLFLDVCKTWEVNDFCTRLFFPLLIPGQSLVVQQDFFHHLEYWVILTHELLHEHFEFIGCVRWNSAVFRCLTPVPESAIPVRLRDFGLDELDRLLERHIQRYEGRYEIDMLSCARAFLHLEFGQTDLPLRIYKDVSASQRGQHGFVQTLEHLKEALGDHSLAVNEDGDQSDAQESNTRAVPLNEHEVRLLAAAATGDTLRVKAMLDKGARVDARDGSGGTALGHAVWFGHLETVRLLISRGADVNARKGDGSTPLQLASDQPEIAVVLKEAGAI